MVIIGAAQLFLAWENITVVLNLVRGPSFVEIVVSDDILFLRVESLIGILLLFTSEEWLVLE